MTEDRGVAIALEGVSKRFGQAAAVRDVSLSIYEGEFFFARRRRPRTARVSPESSSKKTEATLLLALTHRNHP
jgi:hypothetical protein